MDKKRIKILNPFLRKVEQKFSPQKIILFGSRAREDYKEESDYDLLVVAEKFKKIDFYERAVALYHLKRNVPVAMDIVCLTPEEFDRKRKQVGIVQEAVKEGIEIKAS